MFHESKLNSIWHDSYSKATQNPRTAWPNVNFHCVVIDILRPHEALTWTECKLRLNAEVTHDVIHGWCNIWYSDDVTWCFLKSPFIVHDLFSSVINIWPYGQNNIDENKEVFVATLSSMKIFYVCQFLYLINIGLENKLEVFWNMFCMLAIRTVKR